MAREAGTVGPLLGRLFQATFSAAKQVRTDTAIGENPVSVAFAAVSLAKQIFSDLGRSQALLIGAGETITLVARHLHEQGVRRIVVANRTLERASTLPSSLAHTPYCWPTSPRNWPTATSSSVPPPASCPSWARARSRVR